MINLAKRPVENRGEICLRRELSAVAKPDPVARHDGNCFGNEIIRLMSLNPADRAQLKAARRIEVSLRYMMQHLHQPVKVPVLSAMAGLSESSFFALFKSATGLTPLDFFIRARMRRAGELLNETTLQIKEVAARLGYDDQFYFSRLFKSVHGIAPREYRARQQQVANRSVPAAIGPQSGAESGLASARPTRVPESSPLSFHNQCGGPQSQPNQTCLVPS